MISAFSDGGGGWRGWGWLLSVGAGFGGCGGWVFVGLDLWVWI